MNRLAFSIGPNKFHKSERMKAVLAQELCTAINCRFELKLCKKDPLICIIVFCIVVMTTLPCTEMFSHNTWAKHTFCKIIRSQIFRHKFFWCLMRYTAVYPVHLRWWWRRGGGYWWCKMATLFQILSNCKIATPCNLAQLHRPLMRVLWPFFKRKPTSNPICPNTYNTTVLHSSQTCNIEDPLRTEDKGWVRLFLGHCVTKHSNVCYCVRRVFLLAV